MSAKTIRALIRLGISAAVLLVFLVHTSGLWESRLLTTIENVTYDSRIRARIVLALIPQFPRKLSSDSTQSIKPRQSSSFAVCRQSARYHALCRH